MGNQHRRGWMIAAFMLLGVVIGSNFLHDRSGLQGGNSMSVNRIAVDHVRVVADKPFDKVCKAFDQELGQFNPEVYKLLEEVAFC